MLSQTITLMERYLDLRRHLIISCCLFRAVKPSLPRDRFFLAPVPSTVLPVYEGTINLCTHLNKKGVVEKDFHVKITYFSPFPG